nr:MAG TPA: hypothetical protein [Caudoviricetes sp.]
MILIVTFFVVAKDTNKTIRLTIKDRLMHIISGISISELCTGGGGRSRCQY